MRLIPLAHLEPVGLPSVQEVDSEQIPICLISADETSNFGVISCWTTGLHSSSARTLGSTDERSEDMVLVLALSMPNSPLKLHPDLEGIIKTKSNFSTNSVATAYSLKYCLDAQSNKRRKSKIIMMFPEIL